MTGTFKTISYMEDWSVKREKLSQLKGNMFPFYREIQNPFLTGKIFPVTGKLVSLFVNTFRGFKTLPWSTVHDPVY